MTIPRRLLPLLIAVPLLIPIASCVESRHPVLAEISPTIDERLIGTWKPTGDLSVWQVKRSEDTKGALEITVRDACGTSTAVALTTTIKAKGYMSVKDLSEEAQGSKQAAGYEIYQYVFLDNDTVQARGMEPEAIVKAIADKKLGGEIKVTKTERKRILGLFGKAEIVEEKTPVITDSPEGIARYLEAHADECYPSDEDYSLKFTRQKWT